MLSSEGNFTDNKANTPITGETKLTNIDQLLSDRERIFSLIDNLLSLEVCLYHQILPLELKSNQLILGMVNVEDTEALDYVNRIFSYMKLTMVSLTIPKEIHQSTLSNYLSYKNTSSLNPQPQQPQANSNANNNPVPPIEPTEQINTYATTYIETEVETPPASLHKVDLPVKENRPPVSQPSITKPQESEYKKTTEIIAPNNLSVSPLQTSEISRPLELLTHLPPRKLLEQLLARVLRGGIGRLYLERQHNQGRILWSDNGILQSVVENLSLDVFQSIINEFKKFADVPLTTISEAKQVEKECKYRNDNLLLRLRLMPGIYGEEATLQVLRGAALKFYQQQQLSRLSRDTLVMAQKLSFKLHELEKRLLINNTNQSEQLKAIAAITKIVENLDKQLNILAADTHLPRK
ncbi:pilus assembly protein PilB [Calothrix sp. FACHB-1219]|uniref:GspE/PulE/PilB domain-containing protein n=1 Tax=unclassified Calothrix TaxID=2619626 RepID=UPI0016822BCD|nr:MULTISPECIES: pilus assembly protein PilB [unclassified Calothrix]MBD2204619.1 pilus assembly protein PilB [Calothrix sp. FACHB-168]MBD2216869.1 pilus assembly protein PilB [Calothrix sp. FACHB-1219]